MTHTVKLDAHPRGDCMECQQPIWWVPGLGLINTRGFAGCDGYDAGGSAGHVMYLPDLTDREDVETWLDS